MLTTSSCNKKGLQKRRDVNVSHHMQAVTDPVDVRVGHSVSGTLRGDHCDFVAAGEAHWWCHAGGVFGGQASVSRPRWATRGGMRDSIGRDAPG